MFREWGWGGGVLSVGLGVAGGGGAGEEAVGGGGGGETSPWKVRDVGKAAHAYLS